MTTIFETHSVAQTSNLLSDSIINLGVGFLAMLIIYSLLKEIKDVSQGNRELSIIKPAVKFGALFAIAKFAGLF